MRWRFERNLGLCTDQEVVEGLIEVEREFREMAAVLSDIGDRHLRELGIAEEDTQISRSEIRRMILGEGATEV